MIAAFLVSLPGAVFAGIFAALSGGIGASIGLVAKRLGATWWKWIAPLCAGLGLYLAQNDLLPLLKHKASLSACSQLSAMATSLNVKGKVFSPMVVVNSFTVDCSEDTATIDLSLQGLDSQLFHSAAVRGSDDLRHQFCGNGVWTLFLNGGGTLVQEFHMDGQPPYVTETAC